MRLVGATREGSAMPPEPRLPRCSCFQSSENYNKLTGLCWQVPRAQFPWVSVSKVEHGLEVGLGDGGTGQGQITEGR